MQIYDPFLAVHLLILPPSGMMTEASRRAGSRKMKLRPHFRISHNRSPSLGWASNHRLRLPSKHQHLTLGRLYRPLAAVVHQRGKVMFLRGIVVTRILSLPGGIVR
jgi:hypothetical protein